MTELYTCGLCGHRFSTEDNARACANCALFGVGGCHMVRCPKCGYEAPPPGRLPRLIANAFRRVTRRGRDSASVGEDHPDRKTGEDA